MTAQRSMYTGWTSTRLLLEMIYLSSRQEWKQTAWVTSSRNCRTALLLLNANSLERARNNSNAASKQHTVQLLSVHRPDLLENLLLHLDLEAKTWWSSRPKFTSHWDITFVIHSTLLHHSSISPTLHVSTGSMQTLTILKGIFLFFYLLTHKCGIR